MNVITIGLVIMGIVLLGISALGAIRLPDFITRVHSIAVTDTLGVIIILSGLVFQCSSSNVIIKLLLIIVFFCLANPTVTHILTQSALKIGVKNIASNQEIVEKKDR